MTNLECAIAVLATHREARRWADEAVAVDLLARLGLDAAGEVGGAVPPVTEDEARAASYRDQLDTVLTSRYVDASAATLGEIVLTSVAHADQQAAADEAATQV